MREALKKKDNDRDTFMGVFIRFGTKNGYKHKEPTVLLQDVRDMEGNLLTDHLWFNYTKEFKKLWEEKNLFAFDIIKFNARVKGYWKGYTKDEFDFQLSHPRKIEIIADHSWYCKEPNCDPPYKYIKDYFFYSHPYYKLDQEEYTSVRGLDSLDYYELNQKINAKREGEIDHSAIIIKIETRPISSLSLRFLKKDCEYPGFEIKSRGEFIDLLNSFRKNKKAHIVLEKNPELAVFYFHKLMKIPKKAPVFSGFTKKQTISLDRFIKGVKK